MKLSSYITLKHDFRPFIFALDFSNSSFAFFNGLTLDVLKVADNKLIHPSCSTTHTPKHALALFTSSFQGSGWVHFLAYTKVKRFQPRAGRHGSWKSGTPIATLVVYSTPGVFLIYIFLCSFFCQLSLGVDLHK